MKYSDFLVDRKYKPCPFCATDDREKVLENKTAYLTFALAPYHPDHLLVIPKRHVEHLLDVTDEELKDVDELQKKGWELLKKLGYDCVSYVVRDGKHTGESVLHTHFHVIPEVRIGDLDHNNEARKILSLEEINQLVARLKAVI